MRTVGNVPSISRHECAVWCGAETLAAEMEIEATHTVVTRIYTTVPNTRKHIQITNIDHELDNQGVSRSHICSDPNVAELDADIVLKGRHR